MPDRVYALTRIRAGDYIFPANDAQALWRVHSYLEDGSLTQTPIDGRGRATGPSRVIRGTFWAASRFNGTLEEADALLRRDADAFLDHARWTEFDCLLKTRGAAITAALSR